MTANWCRVSIRAPRSCASTICPPSPCSAASPTNSATPSSRRKCPLSKSCISMNCCCHIPCRENRNTWSSAAITASKWHITDMDRIHGSALGAYLGLATGDALGATVEFMLPREIRHHYGTHQDIIGGGWLKLKAGAVTDDTEMSLALGRAL